MSNGTETSPPAAPLKPASTIAIVVVVILGIVSMYLAAAGWVIANLDTKISTETKKSNSTEEGVVYQGVSFANIYEARLAIEREKVTTIFQWVYGIPASLPLLMTALSFGFLGGISNVIYKAIGGEVQTNQRVLLKPFFGGFIGLMVLGITYVLPAVLMANGDSVRPISLAFLCLYAGAFSNHVYLWLEEKIKSIFALEK